MANPLQVPSLRSGRSLLRAAVCSMACASLLACSETPPPVTAPGKPVATPETASAPGPAGPERVTFCNIEYLGKTVFAQAPLPLTAPETIVGWLGDEQGATPRSVELLFTDASGAKQAAVPVALDQRRDDVAKVFPKHPGLADGGFAVALDPAKLPAGTWQVSLLYRAGNGAGAPLRRCDNGRSIHVGTP
jgi:hypothetical protein